MHICYDDSPILMAVYNPKPGDRVRHNMRGFGIVGDDISDPDYCYFYPEEHPNDFAFVCKVNLALAN